MRISFLVFALLSHKAFYAFAFTRNAVRFAARRQSAAPIARKPVSLRLSDDNHNSLPEKNSLDTLDDDGGFDALGFAGYLAPYTLALIASIAVTGAFLKFVLLDY